MRSQFPGRAVFEQALDQSRVHGMACTFGHHAALDAASGKRKITDEVENLVADKFIDETERSIFDASRSHEDRAFRACAADETHVSESLLVSFIAEGACGSDLSAVGFCGEIECEAVAPDGRRKVNGVIDAVAVAWVNANKFFAITHLDRLENAEIFAATALGADACGPDGAYKGECTAVQDGQFKVIDFNDQVVDPHPDQGRQQVFRGGDEHALSHQAGGVADAGNVATDGGNLEVVKIGAAEDDA